MNTNFRNVFFSLIAFAITIAACATAPTQATETPRSAVVTALPPASTVEPTPTVDPGECKITYAFLLDDQVSAHGKLICGGDSAGFNASVVGYRHSLRIRSFGDAKNFFAVTTEPTLRVDTFVQTTKRPPGARFTAKKSWHIKKSKSREQ